AIALLEEERFESTEADTAGDDDSTASMLGMVLEPLTPDSRRRFDISSDVSGALVSEVDGASSAAERGVRPGDVIIEVAQQKVSSPSQASEEIESARDNGRASVLLMLSRAGELRFVAVEFDN
nr:PDZ domain-containing protein [Paracoccaceae bacterium]